MNPRARLVLFLPALAGLAALLVWGLAGLPDFGAASPVYGRVLTEVAVGSRHVTNVPTAINFDYRAIDTLGEEFILFSGALGLAVVRRARREQEQRPPEDPNEQLLSTSDLVRLTGLALAAPLLVLGGYIVVHGHLSPGGGFQGGVIVASAFLLAYLAGTYPTTRRVRPWFGIELTAAVGAGGYAVIGLAGLVAGAAFFENILPLGPMGQVFSGGTIPVSNVAVSLEVAAAFVVIFSELVDQTLVVREQP